MIIPLYPTAWQQKTAVSAVVIGGATRSAGGRTGSKRADDHEGGTARTECEVANTSTPVFVITDKTLKSIEKLVENLKKLGIKDVNGELVYDEEEAGYEYLQ